MRCVSFLSLFCHFFGASSIFLGQAWADGKGKLATCRHRADSGGETVKNVRRHSLDRLHASMIKQKKKLAALSHCSNGPQPFSYSRDYCLLTSLLHCTFRLPSYQTTGYGPRLRAIE